MPRTPMINSQQTSLVDDDDDDGDDVALGEPSELPPTLSTTSLSELVAFVPGTATCEVLSSLFASALILHGTKASDSTAPGNLRTVNFSRKPFEL